MSLVLDRIIAAIISNMVTPACFFSILTKEDDFKDFLFTSLGKVVLPKEEFACKGKNFFL